MDVISNESSSSLSDSCDTSQEDVSERRGKRKATAAAGARPSSKRKRSSYLKVIEKGIKKVTIKETTKETKEETKKVTIKETKNGITKETIKESKQDLRVDALRAEFQAKYQQQNLLGAGGCGSVFAGYCRADKLPVAIKYIPKDKVLCKHVDKNGRQLSVEVAIMLKLAGTSAPVSLLDWYDLDLELIVVMERPVPAVDLAEYIKVSGGSLSEEKAKIILKQLVDAAKELEDKHIFHRDIKVENILIETGSDVPRVRLIDFGLGCFVKKRSLYSVFYGTLAHVPPEWNSHYAYRAGASTVWQMGVVLFDSLHGQIHFETTKFLTKELRIKTNLSKDCQDFLQSCLSKAPEQRPTLDQLRLHPWLR
ncbi:serine/threonine-protein kinase pim-1-like [Pagrus major]|uniref:serine/threonine-protein kinase pim-1-like n=1 Tax=Pagrus major TaxID=143350 RepID=UPI003CC84EDC